MCIISHEKLTKNTLQPFPSFPAI
ncbi:hypothetical protein GCK32_022255 [Trichostrongylus colubriformis]|uniref:Uncharacterized protein n=1 Tax=Trichostrongylus colubriformis TaxID=6319 RepID=A0AAN8F137_TRICO